MLLLARTRGTIFVSVPSAQHMPQSFQPQSFSDYCCFHCTPFSAFLLQSIGRCAGVSGSSHTHGRERSDDTARSATRLGLGFLEHVSFGVSPLLFRASGIG